MNEKIKSFLLGAIAAFVGFLAIVCRELLHNKRNTTDDYRDRFEECQNRAEQQQSNNSAAVAGIEDALEIIRKVREEQQGTENNNSSS